MIISILFTALLGFSSISSSPSPKYKAPENATKVDTVEKLLTALENNEDVSIEKDLDFTAYNNVLLTKNLTFTGSIDGNFHSLKNLNVPLVNLNNGLIENIILEDNDVANIDLDTSAFGNISKINNGTIRSIGVHKSYEFTTSYLGTNHYVGTICAENSGTIEYCYYLGNSLKFDSFDNNLYCGAICADNSATISYSYAYTNVVLSDNHDVSFGKICGTSSGAINNSFSKGSLTITTFSEEVSDIGYICPHNNQINDCYAYFGSHSLISAALTDLNEIRLLDNDDKIIDFIDFTNTPLCDNGIQNVQTLIYEYKQKYYDSFGVENQGVYKDEVIITCGNNYATLNGEPFADDRVSRGGFYDLVISVENGKYQKNIHFSINSTVSGIENNGVYEYDDEPNARFSSCDAYLDDEPYESRHVIKEAGYHKMTFVGENGYSFTYSFLVKPSVHGIQDGGDYLGVLSYSIRGAAHFIDLTRYDNQGNFAIFDPGEHTITVFGKGGYLETRTFTITPSIQYQHADIDLENNEYTGSVTFEVSSQEAIIDGYYHYKTGIPYTKVGHHTLTITGSTGFTKTYKFTLHPYIEGIEQNESVIHYICSDGQSYLDNQQIPNNYTINEPGEHTIYVEGANGYRSEDIKFNVLLSERLTTNKDGTFNFTFSGGRCLLDDEPFNGGNITRIGTHRIVVYGFNDVISYRSDLFRIEKNIDKIPENGKTYTVPPVIPALDAEVYLDGRLIAFNKEHRIETNGEHTIRVVGTNFDKTYHVTYDNPSYTSVFYYGGAAIPALAIVLVVILIRRRKEP